MDWNVNMFIVFFVTQIPVKLINERFIADFSFLLFHAKTPSLAFLHKRRRLFFGGLTLGCS